MHHPTDQQAITAHHTTVELANCRLSLREDLCFHLQDYGGKTCYLIEDEINSKFYRIGMSEYHLISRLDGRTTVSQAVAASSAELGKDAIGEMESLTICKWLLDNQLATTDASRTASRLLQSVKATNRKRTIAKLNPVSFKLNLFNPDRILQRLDEGFGWVFGRTMFFAWLLVVVVGGYHVLANWDGLSGNQNLVFAQQNWIWLGLTWILMKVVHEIAHGVACKRFDGEVRRAGLVLIVMIPLPFVDVTSSWRFRSKWKRIYVAAAGMYAELFLAAVAAIVWSYADVGVVKQVAFNVMLTGSMATLLFNANPLMRFDGYYILSDWLELPNLGTHGQQWIRWLGNKYYLGLDVKRPSWPEGRTGVIGCYAVGALFWKVLICIGLAIAAESLFLGAGFVLSAVAIGFWVLWPLAKLLRFVFVGEESRQSPEPLRFCITTTIAALMFWSIYTYVPWNLRIQVPAIVDYENRVDIRTPLGGFVRELYVKNDQRVVAGQRLALLENIELKAEVQKLKIELEESRLQMRQLRENNEIAAFDVALKNQEAIMQRLAERRSQLECLELYAPRPGVILAEDLGALHGTFLSAGEKFCEIGTGEGKQIQALVSQKHLEQFVGRVGDPVQVRFVGTGMGSTPAILTRVNPRAQNELPNPAFSAVYGGPIAVKFRSRPSEMGSDGEQDQFETVEPHFMARIAMADRRANQLYAGQPAVVIISGDGNSLGQVMTRNISEWIRNLRQQNEALSN